LLFSKIMNFGLDGKVALVTAASKGIGYGTAKVLAGEGCRLVISSRDKESIEKARVSISSSSGNKNIFAISCDLTDRGGVDNLLREAYKKFGGIDILAYNTGSPKQSAFLDLTDDDWDEGISLLLKSAVWLARGVIPSMIQRKWGRLIFITSLTLKQPIRNLVLSNVARLSIAGLSKTLSEEFGSYGITSNIVIQGHIGTDRQRAVIENLAKRTGISFEEAEKGRLREIPAGRFGTPEEIGNTVAFLASAGAAYINGASLNVDGGVIRSVL
jgi:3-oxoacyl-[acyl-carrier protein] reductase